jgi:hypothetical protein
MIRISGTGYNYCSQISVTPRCVGQTIPDFCTCGLRHQKSIPVKSAHTYVFLKRSLSNEVHISPVPWCQVRNVGTRWLAIYRLARPFIHICQSVTLYLALYHIYVRHSPMYDLCFMFTTFRFSIKVLMIDSLTYATFETCSKRRTHWILTLYAKHKKNLYQNDSH